MKAFFFNLLELSLKLGAVGKERERDKKKEKRKTSISSEFTNNFAVISLQL